MPPLNSILLLEGLTSSDEALRLQSQNIVSGFSGDTEVDITAFISALASRDDDLVFWSEIALEHLGDRAVAAIPPLIGLLKRRQLFLRQSAVKALAAVGPSNPDARRAIFLAFQDESPFVRREALQACIRLPNLSPQEMDAIANMSADPDEHVARWSEIALRNIRLRKTR